MKYQVHQEEDCALALIIIRAVISEVKAESRAQASFKPIDIKGTQHLTKSSLTSSE